MLSVSTKSLGAFAAGCLMATASAQQSTMEVVDLVCAPQTVDAVTFMQESQLDVQVLQTLNEFMCSMTCPCPSEANQIYGNLSESDKEYFQRSEMTISESGRSFTTFQECWTQRLSTSDLFEPEFVELMNGFMNTMEKMESESSCSGICQPGLFWFTQPVTIARPTDACISTMLDESLGGEEDIFNHDHLITKLQWSGSQGSWAAGAAAAGGSGSGGNGQMDPNEAMGWLNWLQNQPKDYINLGITAIMGSLYILSLFIAIPPPATAGN